MTRLPRGDSPPHRARRTSPTSGSALRAFPFGLLAVFGVIAAAPAQDSVRSYGYQRFDSRLVEPNPSNPIVEIAAGTYHTMARRSDGSLVAWGMMTQWLAEPPPPPAGVQWTRLWSSSEYSVGLRTDGTLVGWGGSQPFALSPVGGVGYVHVAIGQYHGIALRADGSTFVWGGNLSGETTIPPLPPGVAWVAFAVAESMSYGLRSDGAVVTFGSGTFGERNVPPLPPGTTYVEIDAGSSHAAARRSDGTVVTWGNPQVFSAPALPPGVTYMQVATGFLHSLALRSDGRVAAWGANVWGECNVPPLPSGLTYLEVSAGYGFSVARRSDDRIVAWGMQNVSRCNTPELPAGTQWAQVSWGDFVGAMRRSDGTLRIWGGLAMTGLPTTGYVDVSIGGAHALARRTGGSVVAWGANSFGECNVPALPAGLSYVEISAGGGTGSGHSIALRSDGSAIAWGNPIDGECNVPALPPGMTYVQVDAGYRHTLAVRSDGELLAFGGNWQGQCNVPPLPPRTRYVRAAGGRWHSAALRSDGQIVTWGRTSNGLANVPLLPPGVVYVDVDCSLGDDRAAARTSDGGAVSWGNGSTWPAIAVPPPEPGIGYAEVDVGSNVVVRAAARSAFTRFGPGCAGSLPAAPIVPSDTPRLGTSMQVTVRELPVDAAFLLAGFGTTMSHFGPLPLALGPLGMPNCTAFVSDETVHFLAGSGGEARWTLGTPYDPTLVGVTFSMQAIVLDPAAGNPLGAVMSDAMRALVGGR